MELDVNILRDMLTERGFYPGNRGNEHVWKNVINGIPYAVDFRIGSVFRYMYGQREEDVEDEVLADLKTAIIAVMQDTTGGQDVQATEATNQEPEIPPTETVVTQEDKPIEAPAKSSILDLIRGYVGNDVLEVFGDTGSGKSKFALTVAREAIEAGKRVYYLDTERNLTDADIKSLKGCEYKYTPVIEEIDKLVQKLPAVDVVIIDSIGFPVLTSYARLSVKQKGDALLKLIAIFGDLKKWAYLNNGVAIVTNQPESEFNKSPDHVLRPFGDKSQFAAKEIWKTEIANRNEQATNIIIKSFRSRSTGHGAKIAGMKITSAGVEVV